MKKQTNRVLTYITNPICDDCGSIIKDRNKDKPFTTATDPAGAYFICSKCGKEYYLLQPDWPGQTYFRLMEKIDDPL